MADNPAVSLAIGRILRIMSRPFQPGDVEEYEGCRSIILNEVEAPETYTVNYARDHRKGAAGD